VSDKDWEKLMAQVDKQIESVSDQQVFPDKKGAAPAQKAATAVARDTTKTWPAIVRLVLSSALGIGVLFWPYANRCGFGLSGYLLVVAVVALSGVWSAVWTWRHQTAKAHVLSILLIVWGLVLAGAEVLPRTGYAKQTLTWACKK
jgi:hypothetical protein